MRAKFHWVRWMLGLGLLPMAGAAQEYGFEWSTNEDGTINIVHCWEYIETDVIIPGEITGRTVTTIGDSAFSRNLDVSPRSVVIPETIVRIGSNVFEDCWNLRNIAIPDSVTNIGSECFLRCYALETAALGDGVRQIPQSLFKLCTNLSLVSLGTNIHTVGTNAFWACENLNEIYCFGNAPQPVYPDAASSLGTDYAVMYRRQETMGWDETWSGWPVASFQLPTNFTWLIGADCRICINGYSGLGVDVEVPGNIGGLHVTQLASFLFASNTVIHQVVLPDTVTNLGVKTFISCSSMTNVVLGAGLTRIGSNDFALCTNLTHIFIPPNVVDIGPLAFVACYNMEDLAVDEASPAFCSVDGILYDKTRGTLVQFPQARGGEFILPASVTNIANGALAYCRELERVYFQSAAPRLGWPFAGSDSLTCYFLPDTTGWGATYGGRPTALWLPEVQAEGLGVSGGKFGFTLQWAVGKQVVIEACTNLIAQDWVPIETNVTAKDGVIVFYDIKWFSHPGRFYRTQPAP